MAQIKIQVTVSEKELIDLICKRYNLDVKKATVHVKQLPGNQREPAFIEIIVESVMYETIEKKNEASV